MFLLSNAKCNFEQDVYGTIVLDYVGWDVPADWLLVSTDGDVCGLAPASYLELVKNNSRLEYNTTTNSRSRLNCDDKFEIM